MSARYIIGDTRDVLATIPDGSIDLVMTSPPFLALRSYLPADHPDKHREIGSEPDPVTPDEFGRALGWPRTLTKGAQSWASERGTYTAATRHGMKVTHRLTAEEWWVPCDAIGLEFVRAFDADRPSA